MPKVRVHNYGVSIDGYAAGPHQSIDNPLGVGGEGLHSWVFTTASGRRMFGLDVGDATPGDLNDRIWQEGDEGIGATIMGRNMFGPIRGPWGDEEWTGWWGEEPPYHHPVFVLTHHAHPPIEMKGGTTFHFVGGGIEAALSQAMDAAGGLDVRIGGGASCVQQYLRARLIDELHLAVAPVLLGAGERFFDHLDGGPDGYEVTELVCGPGVAHVRLVRTPD